MTIVEPGGTATGFRRNAVLSSPLTDYDNTPAAMVRGLSTGTRPSPGDPVKVAAAIIAAAETEPAPLRVVLGSDSFQYVHQALTERLADSPVSAPPQAPSTSRTKGCPVTAGHG